MQNLTFAIGCLIGPPWVLGGAPTPSVPPHPGVYFARIDPYK
jgi:hypothetical protein